MKLAINGSAGRMGRLLGKLADEFGFEIVAACEHKDSQHINADFGELLTGKKSGVQISDKIDTAPDVIIDFSLPEALPSIVEQALQKKCALITGTTGLTNEHFDLLKKASEKIPVMHSANFSIGIAVLKSLVEQAAQVLYPLNFDIEILEAHHNKKLDAPSGTALMLGKAAAQGAKLEFEQAAKLSREGKQAQRKRAEIGFAAVRAGTIVGEHTVLFAGNEEIVEIKHRALNREIFARGALSVARWLVGKPAALYTIDNFIEGK